MKWWDFYSREEAILGHRLQFFFLKHRLSINLFLTFSGPINPSCLSSGSLELLIVCSSASIFNVMELQRGLKSRDNGTRGSHVIFKFIVFCIDLEQLKHHYYTRSKPSDVKYSKCDL